MGNKKRKWEGEAKGPSDSADRTFLIPYGRNLRFFGRDKELQSLKEALEPGTQLRAIGIHGLGGVGKTQLALQYANTSLGTYQVIAWIPADTQTNIVHALSDLAKKLGLVDGANGEDDCENAAKVRDWLNTASKPFLLIFDDVEDIKLLGQIWPASDQGSIIITTRSPSVASGRTTTTLALGSFSEDTSGRVLRSLSQLEFADGKESAAAHRILRNWTSGLPLAVMQLSNFIRNRRSSYVEAERMLQDSKSAKQAYTSGAPAEYDYTIITTWNTSLQRLSSEATALLHLLSFFHPDLIPERLITGKDAEVYGAPLKFALDDFSFCEAVAELTQTSLVTRDCASKHLSIHPIVRVVVFNRLPESDRITAFDLAVRILTSNFPATWNGGGPHQGHGWASWAACGLALPHVRMLRMVSGRHKINPTAPDLWAELLFRAGTYRWEKEEPLFAKPYFEDGLRIGENLPAAVTAQAKQVLGHVLIDLARPRAALTAYEDALILREGLEGPDSPAVADVFESMACAHTELGDVDQAFACLKKATAIHKAHDPSKMSRALAIRAMTCLCAGVADDALVALRECWRLQGMTQEQIEASKYPRHSGDILLLARILWFQRKRGDALKLAERVPHLRAAAYGQEGGLRFWDAIFVKAQMHDADGDPEQAATTLRRLIALADEKGAELEPQRARAFWFYAKCTAKLDSGATADEARKSALSARSGIAEREWPDEDTDEGFMRLVPWMLW